MLRISRQPPSSVFRKEYTYSRDWPSNKLSALNRMLDFDFHLTTPRLFISHLSPTNDAHYDFVYELVFSPGLVEQKPAVDAEKAESATPRDVGRKFIAKDVERMETTGYGRYLVSLRQNSALHINSPHEDEDVPFSKRRLTPIGIVSMQLARFPSEPSAPTIPDVGFSFLPRYLGNGYATEAAAGLIEYFTDVKGHKEFCGFCKPENTASANVLKRLGFEERGLREVDGVVEGEILSALVWTIGVGHEKGALEKRGLQRVEKRSWKLWR
ncbi:GNAT domain-containing protein [Alternaria rosae]|uniref:GNAT domain-containing protein n=1 Tax=Alternaria rosae TaxID=1187941 RepID=UPI001E8E2E21|nr:GNAT domain-containing protein [Alternaria rosae]KAH6865191.1 GNAT domain-containing protein [Alternaria rosae]